MGRYNIYQYHLISVVIIEGGDVTMGRYTSESLVRSTFKRFKAGVIDADQIEHFIIRVDGLIDGILYKLYDLPLTNVLKNNYDPPEIIISIATDMVTARCMKYFYDSNQTTDNETAGKMWSENLKMLLSMVNGKPAIMLPCKFRGTMTITQDGEIDYGVNTAGGPGLGIWSTSFDDEKKSGFKQVFDMDDWTDSKLDFDKTWALIDDRRG